MVESLADKIIEQNNKPDYEVDELGLGVRLDKPDYFAARAIYINYLERKKDYMVPLLHKRQGVIYYGNKVVQETRNNFYKYTAYTNSVKPGMIIQFWESLRRVLPELDTSKIIISDHYLFNRRTGQLEKGENLLLRGV